MYIFSPHLIQSPSETTSHPGHCLAETWNWGGWEVEMALVEK